MDDHRLLDAKIARRRDEAEGIISLELVPIAASTLPQFEAGSHIDVQVTPEIKRQYSCDGLAVACVRGFV
jgi:vanillate O-demethylase ferredoxin subunit